MVFNSILFNQETIKNEDIEQSSFFKDLNLDQVIEAIIHYKKDYNIKPYFYTPLHDYKLIEFRTEIMKNLEDPELSKIFEQFSQKMIVVNRYLKLIEKLDFPYHKKGWYLDTILTYCTAITNLTNNLDKIDLNARGLLELHQYIKDCTKSDSFIQLFTNATQIKNDLLAIRYCVNVQHGSFSVRKYDEEVDYSIEVLQTFNKFRQGAVKDYKVNLFNRGGMNHIEAKILDFVVRLFPKPFQDLVTFCDQFPTFMDEKIIRFDLEIQFYLAYLQFINRIKDKGLNFCYPLLSTTKKEIYDYNGFDIALALKYLHSENKIICNDFSLSERERIIVVSGPNQGGKTTFARMFGQLHYLTRLGCPIPGTKAKIFLSDKIFTHFEREEDVATLHGKLQEELVRIHTILSESTSNSIVIINEIFTSTTLDDAIFLSKEILAKLSELDLFCVIVTFIDELSRLGPNTVSMVSSVVPETPTLRTFKVIRKNADGLAYALAIAKKHRLTYDQIKERITS